MLLSVAVFAQAMYGFKVENRGLNHARINSESEKLTVEKKKNKTDSLLCNQLAGYNTKEEVECGGAGKENTPTLQFFLPSLPWSLFSRYVTSI